MLLSDRSLIVMCDLGSRTARWTRVLNKPRALQPYLGHKNIQHTVRYTELSPIAFQRLLKSLARREGLVGVCPAGLTSLIKSRALSGREPLHERLSAFENLGRSGDPRQPVLVSGRGGEPTAGEISDCFDACHTNRPCSIQ